MSEEKGPAKEDAKKSALKCLENLKKNNFSGHYFANPNEALVYLISFGVANDFPGEAASNRVRLQRPIRIAGQEFEGFGFRIYNDDPTMAPPGKTVVQVTLTTDYDSWCNLQKKDRPRYDAEKERFDADVLAQMETYLPGITSQVEVTDVATPLHFLALHPQLPGFFRGLDDDPGDV